MVKSARNRIAIIGIGITFLIVLAVILARGLGEPAEDAFLAPTQHAAKVPESPAESRRGPNPSVAAREAPVGRIRVSVIDGEGRAIPRALVFDGENVHAADLRGLAEVPQATAEIRVSAKGYVPAVHAIASAERAGGVTVRLSEGLSFVGRLSCADGAPVAGARVRITRGGAMSANADEPDGPVWARIHGDERKRTYQWVATTDADGRFELSGLMPGRHSLTVGPLFMPSKGLAFAFDPALDRTMTFEVSVIWAAALRVVSHSGGEVSPDRYVYRWSVPRPLEVLSPSFRLVLIDAEAEVRRRLPADSGDVRVVLLRGPPGSDVIETAITIQPTFGEPISKELVFVPLSLATAPEIAVIEIDQADEPRGKLRIRSAVRPAIQRVVPEDESTIEYPLPPRIEDGAYLFDVPVGTWEVGIRVLSRPQEPVIHSTVEVRAGATTSVDLSDALRAESGIELDIRDAADRPTDAYLIYISELRMEIAGAHWGPHPVILLAPGHFSLGFIALDGTALATKEIDIKEATISTMVVHLE